MISQVKFVSYFTLEWHHDLGIDIADSGFTAD